MGPLHGVKIIEFVGIGPGPFCAMLLSDLGAEVIAIERIGNKGQGNPSEILTRGRKSIALDLKQPAGLEVARKLVSTADGLIEGFRPGVMEKLGLGPEESLASNPKLVYGRITGWGQFGPLAKAAGHDINYIALSGALHAMGEKDRAPMPPLNLVGDFGGGGMLLAVGILAALLEAKNSGQGQVVDAAMTDGSSLLMAMIYAFKAAGTWENQREYNFLDGAAHFYSTYRCADNKWICIGSIEPQFYALLREKADITDNAFDAQFDRKEWPALKQQLAEIFLTKTRAEWCELMEGTDVCFAPVLDLDEAPNHPHNIARQTFQTVEGVIQPSPAPRFSRTVAEVQSSPVAVGDHSDVVLREHGYDDVAIEKLRAANAI